VLTDTHCRVGLSLIDRFLKLAVDEPDNITARSAMSFAALNAGMAINTAGTAGLHAIQGPVGNLTGTPHGVGIGVLLRYVIRFTVSHRQAAFEDLAELWGLNGGAGAAERALERIDALLDSVGIPSTIAELGVKQADIPGLAAAAMGAGRLVRNSPRPMTEETTIELLERAMSGDRTVWS
jgi:alcohol dehydrogenase class IV